MQSEPGDRKGATRTSDRLYVRSGSKTRPLMRGAAMPALVGSRPSQSSDYSGERDHGRAAGSALRNASACFQFSAAPFGSCASISVEAPCTPNCGTYWIFERAGDAVSIALASLTSSASGEEVT